MHKSLKTFFKPVGTYLNTPFRKSQYVGEDEDEAKKAQALRIIAEQRTRIDSVYGVPLKDPPHFGTVKDYRAAHIGDPQPGMGGSNVMGEKGISGLEESSGIYGMQAGGASIETLREFGMLPHSPYVKHTAEKKADINRQWTDSTEEDWKNTIFMPDGAYERLMADKDISKQNKFQIKRAFSFVTSALASGEAVRTEAQKAVIQNKGIKPFGSYIFQKKGLWYDKDDNDKLMFSSALWNMQNVEDIRYHLQRMVVGYDKPPPGILRNSASYVEGMMSGIQDEEGAFGEILKNMPAAMKTWSGAKQYQTIQEEMRSSFDLNRSALGAFFNPKQQLNQQNARAMYNTVQTLYEDLGSDNWKVAYGVLEKGS